jgi:hypothetical protein
MLPANPTAHRKELAHRERMRLEQIEELWRKLGDDGVK